MGITRTPTTFPGCYAIICNSCGGKENWEIHESEYKEDEKFYDNWKCEDCRKFDKKRR